VNSCKSAASVPVHRPFGWPSLRPARREAVPWRSSAFACRCCHNLSYASQREIPRHRAISRVQKIRMRLGRSANLLERVPKKPRGMHRWTYRRLFAKAMAAQERSIALELDYMRRQYPGFEPGERRRELISATTGCSEPAWRVARQFPRAAGRSQPRMVAAERPFTTLGVRVGLSLRDADDGFQPHWEEGRLIGAVPPSAPPRMISGAIMARSRNLFYGDQPFDCERHVPSMWYRTPADGSRCPYGGDRYGVSRAGVSLAGHGYGPLLRAFDPSIC
jgi:hypothetical protein